MIGVLVISHGSRNEEWVRLVNEAVAPLKEGMAYPVFCSFLELVEGRLIQDGIDALERLGVTKIIVVPLFVSSGSTHLEEIAWALGVKADCRVETDIERFRIEAEVFMCAPMDADDEVVAILCEKLASLSQDPSKEIVLLIGHGSHLPDFYERWERMLSEAAGKLKQLGGFLAADSAMLLPDQLKEKLAFWRSAHPELSIIAAPFFVSEGYFTSKVIPEKLKGFHVRYNGQALLPHPLISRWMKRRVHEQIAQLQAAEQSVRDASLIDPSIKNPHF